MNLHKIMCSYEAKIFYKNANNMFKEQFLVHPDEVLCIIIVEYSSY
jgi:hypothetical protein